MRKLVRQPGLIARNIDPAYVKRARQVPDDLVGSYLDNILITLHSAVDDMRYHGGPLEAVNLSLDAFIALLTTAESRGIV